MVLPSGVTAMPPGHFPAGMALPGLLVTVLIGVTIPGLFDPDGPPSRRAWAVGARPSRPAEAGPAAAAAVTGMARPAAVTAAAATPRPRVMCTFIGASFFRAQTG